MFSYDGKWIFYSSMENGSYSIFKIKTDGTGKAPNHKGRD
jgi:Tol biopolymer transport system component